jgi:hypothetical protein
MAIRDTIRDLFKSREARMLQTDLVKMVTGYSPVFSTYSGGVYEMDLTVSAIDSFARHVSKANPKIKGTSYKNIEKQFEVYMNETMTTSQFLYRAATIYKCENNVFIIPIYDQYQFIVGFYPVSTVGAMVTNVNGELMLKYVINGRTHAIPYKEVVHLKSHHYRNELVGEGNSSLYATLNLLNTQNQGIIDGVKQSATIRFIAKIANILKPSDMKTERERLLADNFGSDNNGGVLLFDGKYADIKQVDSKPFIVDAEQSNYIRGNVYNYFGTNEAILQNKFNEQQWGAYYEGEIEPFLIQLSQAMTRVMFTNREISFGNMIIWESSRLQYADTATKLSLITQLFDRGFLTHNQGLKIMNLPPRDDGDQYFIRREYAEIHDIDKPVEVQEIEGTENDTSD